VPTGAGAVSLSAVGRTGKPRSPTFTKNEQATGTGWEEVRALLANGMTWKAIARKLGVARSTVQLYATHGVQALKNGVDECNRDFSPTTNVEGGRLLALNDLQR